MAGSNKDKTSVKFWEGKVYKLAQKGAHGNETVSPYLYANLCHGNKTARVCLQTANKLEAANRARDAYILLKSSGWDAMWEIYRVRKSRVESEKRDARHRGEPVAAKDEKKEGEIETVGQFIEKIEQICFTLREYISRFRRKRSEIYNVNHGNEKCNYVNEKNLK
jgi:hypothetical protein